MLHYTFKCFCYFVAIVFYTIINHTNSNAVNISNVRFWNTIHGLQNRVINCIVKDPNGYIWLDKDSSAGVGYFAATSVYTATAPSTNLANGLIWIKKGSSPIEMYVYNGDTSVFDQVI